ncbi:MAG: hypothetical protein HY737_04605 [Candidatus Omnitrophica bacterium]|nr:hypothetical protein [Candidatus Omnitrophota bacterium]
MKIASIAYALPSKKVTNDMVIRDILRHHQWKAAFMFAKGMVASRLRQGFVRAGTLIRYHRNQGERAIDLTLKAGTEALRKAGIAPEQIDLLIYTGVGRAWLEPAMANLFQSELGLTNATCFDVTDACASWLRSLFIAKSFVDQGTYKTVMIINSEFMCLEACVEPRLRRLEDLYLRFAGYTVGEVAVATIVTAGGDPNNFYFSFKNWSNTYHLCQIPMPNAHEYIPSRALVAVGASGKPANGHNIQYQTMALNTLAKDLLFTVVEKLTEHYKSDPALSREPHDIIFCHDVSDVSTQMGIAHMGPEYASRVFRTHARFGNTVSASIPLGIALALEEGKLKPGMSTLIVCGASGVTTGFCKFRYE